MNLSQIIDPFLDQIADTLDYDRDSLVLESEIHSARSPGDGPSVRPGEVPEDNVLGYNRYPEGSSFPDHWYDSLMPFHVEHRVAQLQSEGDIEIPRVIYSFQHHPFPGNCRIAINRWVQVLDDVEWPSDLIEAGLRFRARVARHKAKCSLLTISTGKSFGGAEPKDSYEHLFSGTGRSLYLLNLEEFL